MKMIIGAFLGFLLALTIMEYREIQCDAEYLNDIPYGAMYLCVNNGKLISMSR